MKLNLRHFLAGLLLAANSANAMYVEDAGVLDFQISTAGHGAITFVHTRDGTVLTTDASPSAKSTSCYVASRAIDDGSLLWRRNVCSTPSASQRHAVATSSTGDIFFTMDDSGIVRAWTREAGNLIWDTQVTRPSGSSPKIWSISQGGNEYVAVASNGELTLLNATSGTVVSTINALAPLESSNYKIKPGETLQWLGIYLSGEKVQGMLAFVQEDGTTKGDRMLIVELAPGFDAFSIAKPWSHAKSTFVASLIETQLIGENRDNLALTTKKSPVDLSNAFASAAWHPDVKSIVAVQATPISGNVRVEGTDNEGSEFMGLFRFDETGSTGWEQHYGAQENANSQVNGMAYCSQAELVVATGKDALKAYRHDSLIGTEGGKSSDQLSPLTPLTVKGDIFVSTGDSVQSISVVECTTDTTTLMISTAGGTTTLLKLVVADNSVTAKVGWTAEEGLASVSAVVVLDASHLGKDDLVEEQEVVANKFSLSSRLSSQLEGLVSLVGGASTSGVSRRDHTFGFVKIAAMLSQSAHRMWGIATSGSDRGSIRWSLSLPKSADWHVMVHGTTNSHKATHGINGGTDSREILVLSAASLSMEWKCIDGTSGAIHTQGVVPIASPVIQVIPMYGSAGNCRQAAMLLHEDLTVSLVPQDAGTAALVEQQLASSPNGMYTHYINKESSKLESYQIASYGGSFVPRQVGRTSFAGERIVRVAYPMRDEVVQSMSAILGDNSLLLKYLNPHIAVVITMADDDNTSPSSLVASIEKGQGLAKRKPAGAGDTATSTESISNDTPNMFVNVVDTVSGRVLHRASHANADPARNVVALISENWIIYSYVNARTRRTEIGVLTLHEGMIDSTGISLFTSPEQTTTFSSFDARQSKPVVLSKTYTYPKFITALGVTATRGGISSRNILIASDDGKITSVNRLMLETRRPMGQVKEAEKQEGLVPYNELIMQVPFAAISRNLTIESVSAVVSAPTALESQSLVIAFGGPDLFFTRTSPSKGFDLLPDSFSRIFVSIVTGALVVILFVAQRMASQKELKQAWQ